MGLSLSEDAIEEILSALERRIVKGTGGMALNGGLGRGSVRFLVGKKASPSAVCPVGK